MRQKLFMLLPILFLLLFPIISSAAYRVELDGGSTFLTNKFWFENNLIYFTYKGGLVNFPKKNVVRIVKTPQKIIDPEPVQPAPEKKGDNEKSIKPVKTVSDRPETKETPLVDIQPDIDKFPSEYKDYNRLLTLRKKTETLHSEASMANDYSLQKKAEKEMKIIDNMLIRLKESIKRRNQNQLPSWWKE